jgi:dethiobiotin synthetase
MGALFVSGTGTDVGKTWVAAALVRELLRQGCSVDVLKPVVSGFDPDHPRDSDPAVLIRALGRTADAAEIARVSPFQFRAPLAPPQAAAREGQALPLEPLVELCRSRIAGRRTDWLLIEGAGGVMSPIAEDATGLDLMGALNLPGLLVAGSYLGAISHALTAIESLRARKLAPLFVAVSARGGDDPPVVETRDAIERFSGVATLVVGPGHPEGLLRAVQILRA